MNCCVNDINFVYPFGLNPEKSVLQRQAKKIPMMGLRTLTEGDDVMIRDFRQGRSWTAAVISHVLGPVTYLVETVNGLRWKRHTDQIKGLSKPPDAPEEADDSGPYIQPTLTLPNDSGTEEEDPTDDPTEDNETDSVRRCPTRVRRPTDRL